MKSRELQQLELNRDSHIFKMGAMLRDANKIAIAQQLEYKKNEPLVKEKEATIKELIEKLAAEKDRDKRLETLDEIDALKKQIKNLIPPSNFKDFDTNDDKLVDFLICHFISEKDGDDEAVVDKVVVLRHINFFTLYANSKMDEFFNAWKKYCEILKAIELINEAAEALRDLGLNTSPYSGNSPLLSPQNDFQKADTVVVESAIKPVPVVTRVPTPVVATVPTIVPAIEPASVNATDDSSIDNTIASIDELQRIAHADTNTPQSSIRITQSPAPAQAEPMRPATPANQPPAPVVNEYGLLIEDVIAGIKKYQKLKGSHLCCLVRFFDGGRGERRADLYVNALCFGNYSEKDRLYMIYALLTSKDGFRLQKEVVRSVRDIKTPFTNANFEAEKSSLVKEIYNIISTKYLNNTAQSKIRFKHEINSIQLQTNHKSSSPITLGL